MSEQPRPPEARQFDFWLGEWHVTWGEDQHGTNVIRSILDDAVILENFEGGGLQGMSVSTYNAETRHWQQTWVDNQAGYLDFNGEFKDGRMILQRTAHRKGETFQQRMVWYNIAPHELDWNWERSDDDGATWRVLWHIHYARKT